MPAGDIIYTSGNIGNGFATVGNGASVPKIGLVNAAIIPTGQAVLTNITGRYDYHGGTNGSGNWEH